MLLALICLREVQKQAGRNSRFIRANQYFKSDERQRQASEENLVTNILFVTDTRRDEDSRANRVAGHLLERLQKHRTDARFTIRDLARNPLPFANDNFVRGMKPDLDPAPEAQSVPAGHLDQLLEETKDADIIVISVSMRSSRIPLYFKTWIDALYYSARSAVPGEVHSHRLMSGKHIFLVVDRTEKPDLAKTSTPDFRLPYLQSVLGMMGAANLRVVDLKGTACELEEAKKMVATGVRRAFDVVDRTEGYWSIKRIAHPALR
jgi:FMN-dependent NADH-azoreductase